jgi:hypothetical protein
MRGPSQPPQNYCGVVVAVDVATVGAVVEASPAGTIEGASVGSMMRVRVAARRDIAKAEARRGCPQWGMWGARRGQIRV